MMMSGKEYTTFLFNKDDFIGEVRVRVRVDEHNTSSLFSGKVMRVSDFSPPSDRCLPLHIMHSIAPSSGGWLALDPLQPQQLDGLSFLYSSCLHEQKTAIIQMGEKQELHLVAMSRSDQSNQGPCFWGFVTCTGAYASCLAMLNSRCLALVFDLDETLIAANTLRSFEDRIEAVNKKLWVESDAKKSAILKEEVRRFQEDQSILQQYMETDQVVDNGKLVRVKTELVPASSDVTRPMERPVLRLEERNVILTRIDPSQRRTSVLMRPRPAWEELRSYLTANGRKRFEVYICTMSDKEYALEMWRLLDPEASLIPSIELQKRIVCVKAGPGIRKSLRNVFQEGQCHPRMAMVVDDRLDVWEDVDQPRVYVVPGFSPYTAPQPEAMPTLSATRIVATKVRNGFFKDFDETFMQQLASAGFETDSSMLPKPLDVSSYLPERIMPELPLITKDLHDGMCDAETERAVHPPARDLNVKLEQPGELSGENWEEGEVPDSELDPDTRRRLLILQHGQDRPAGPSTDWDAEEKPGSSGNPMMNLMRAQKCDRKLLDYSDADDQASRPNGTRENASAPAPDPKSPIVLLRALGQKYKAQIDFNTSVSSTHQLQFCVEVTFNNEKISRAFAKKRMDARTRAAEDALRFLSHELRDSTFLPKQEAPAENTSFNNVTALKELCSLEDMTVSYRELEHETNGVSHSCEVEVNGRVMGRGKGHTWEAAKQMASAEALKMMKTINSGKRPRSPPPATGSNKKMRLASGRVSARGNRRMSPQKTSQLPVRLK